MAETLGFKPTGVQHPILIAIAEPQKHTTMRYQQINTRPAQPRFHLAKAAHVQATKPYLRKALGTGKQSLEV
jgi:hypothetical protein